MELIDRQNSEDLKSKFLAWHIIDFYKNHMLSSYHHTPVNSEHVRYCEKVLLQKETHQE